jgi:precorrin-2 dehydrogenase / sirohydrochlorin ferrochelatase
MKFLPITINITDKKILLVGGGRIANHKIGFLEQFTSNIEVVGKEVIDDIKKRGLVYKEKSYEKADLNGAFLVYACTNIIELNQQVKNDAESLGILCNVVDNPKLCDFVSPAIYKKGIYTVAVGSNAQNVYKAIEIRNKIKTVLENDKSIFCNSAKIPG